MKIKEFIEVLEKNNLLKEYKINIEKINNITYNSKEVIDNTLFICKGFTFKEEYLKEAKGKGATIYLSEVKYNIDMDYIIVSDVRCSMALLSILYYKLEKPLCKIGITGTKGKTTTVYFINSCLNNILSIVMNIVYSMIFGFYFLIKKNETSYFKFIPEELRCDISKNLRLYIRSIVLDTLFMFTILSITFSITGLSSPILFALFCAVTNIIPYIGPYIGGVPAIIIGLSKSFKLGIIITIIIMAVQSLENNIVQPMIVSKNVNLNPIYILIGIIIFSHFFGIIGMILSTPILLIIRSVYKYYKKNKPKKLISFLGTL